MTLTTPHFRPPPLPEPAPMVQVVAREDVLWYRPIFKVPNLQVIPNPGKPSRRSGHSQGRNPAGK